MRGLSSRSRRQAFPGPIQRGIPNRSVYCLGMTGNRWGISRLKYAAKQPGLPGRSGDTEKRKKEKAMAYRYKKYEQSETVKKAREELEKQEGTKPGAYASRWQGWLDDTIGKILNREEFSYDMNADALYNQYRDWYVREGKLAMQDTMGQAAALTGGYGNSYAQNAGQQAYNSYLQGLNDKLPELYQMALSKYQAEGDQLNDQAGLLGDRESQDYNRWQDQNNLWQNDRNFAYGQYQDELGRQDQLDAQDKALAQEQVKYLLSLGVKPNDDLLKKAGYDSQYTDTIWQQNQPTSGGSGGGGGSGSRNPSYGDLTLEEMMQNAVAAGASDAELSEILNAAVADKVISPSDSNDWAYNFGIGTTGDRKNKRKYEAPNKGRTR